MCIPSAALLFGVSRLPGGLGRLGATILFIRRAFWPPEPRPRLRRYQFVDALVDTARQDNRAGTTRGVDASGERTRSLEPDSAIAR